MSNTIQFIGTTPTDLVSEIKLAIIPELKRELSAEFQPKQPTEYLTRSQVCDILQIDLSTLHRWRKDNILSGYGIGNRVYFKRNEIEELINKNKLR
jgi:predicted DNA-binding transcriptional regulator AlpA